MELFIESPCQNVTWKVRDFFQLPSEFGYSLESPEFRFAGDRYCLRLYPNGDNNGDTNDIHLQLVRLTSLFPERNVLCKVGCREIRLSELLQVDMYVCPDTLNDDFRFLLLSRSEIEVERDMNDTDGTLTVLCFMRLGEQSCAGSPQSEEAGSSDAEEKQERLTGVVNLQSDYRRLLEKGAETDACFLEKESGRVAIDDFDQENFVEFLEYLYTGGVRAGFLDDNAFGLYAAADRYDMPTLKSECVGHMLRTLSVDSFCDVMTLALRYHEEELLQRAIQFFKQNLERIIVTAKWQQFVIDNGTSANELFVKALVPRRQ